MSSTRKTMLAVAASATAAMGMSDLAFAVHISGNGLGQVGLVPYYTVENGLDTNISIVNTSDKYVVAVKVRFREAKYSEDVRDFNIFLSPNDVWTATVTKNANNIAEINITDPDAKSCAVPSMEKPEHKQFTTVSARGGSVDPNSGHIEIIEMGIADPDDKNNQIAKAAMHKKNSNPDCGFIVDSYLPETARKYNKGTYPCRSGDPILSKITKLSFSDRFEAEFCGPENNLKISANLVSKTGPYTVEVPVDMLANFYNPADPALDLMQSPAAAQPDLLSVEPFVADLLTDNGSLKVTFIDAEVSAPLSTVSALFAATGILNEYDSNTNTNTTYPKLTDWVITAPLNSYEPGASSPYYPIASTYFDRNEHTPKPVIKSEVLPSGGPTPTVEPEIVKVIQNETQVLNFGTLPLLGDGMSFSDRADSKYNYESGWMKIDIKDKEKTFESHTFRGVAGKKNVTIQGIPVTGFAATSTTAANSDGTTTSTTAVTMPHAYNRSIIIE